MQLIHNLTLHAERIVIEQKIVMYLIPDANGILG